MSTIPTQNPVPSEAARDLKFNSGKIDEFVTSNNHFYTDRFGKKHYTIDGINYLSKQAMQNYGYITKKSFESGNTIINPNDVLLWESNGEYYRWDGELPKVVSAGSTPESAGGIGGGKWVGVGDASLRGEMLSPSSQHIPAIASQYSLNYKLGKLWEPGVSSVDGDWFVYDKNGCVEVWDGVGVLSDSPKYPFQRIVTKMPAVAKPCITMQPMPRMVDCFVNFTASDKTKYFEMSFRVGDVADDIKVILKNFSATSSIDINESPSGIGVVYVAQDDKAGSNPTYLKSNVTTSVIGSDLVVTLSKSSVPVGRYCRFSIRCTNSDVFFEKAYMYLGEKKVAHSALNWMGKSNYKEFVDAKSNFSVKFQTYDNSTISTDSLLLISHRGCDNFTSEILNLERAFNFYSSEKGNLKRIVLVDDGIYYNKLKQRQWIIRGDCDIWAPNGATVLGGVEMKTGSWVQVENTERSTFYCKYDASTNPDSAIRNGTKQPFVYVEMQTRSIESAFTRELKNVLSIDAVKDTDFSYYFDHSNGNLYFSWNKENQNAYLYVCESDSVFYNDGNFNVNIWGINAKAVKVNCFDFRNATYINSEFGGPIAKLYDCNASVAFSGNGFSTNNYDCVLYNCNGKSVGNDGAGFHNNGVSYIIGGSYSNNSDDGISHHENCVGYVIGSHLKYNGAGNSTPAFGAKVYHWDIVSRKAKVTKTKPYAGTLACISGQDFDKTEAYYFTCDTDNGYFAESQQSGKIADLHAYNRCGDDINIISTQFTNIFKS